MLYWLTTLLSLLGVLCNIHGRRVCFVCWMVSNAIWAIADWRHGLPQQAVLQTVYFGLSVYGAWTWGRHGGPPRPTGNVTP